MNSFIKSQNNSIQKLPNALSREGKALAYLLQGNRLSHLDFQEATDSYRLSAPICNLRHDNWPIDDVWAVSANGRKFKRYFISNENIQHLYRVFDGRLELFVKATKLAVQ